jgi:alpha 1,4-N-acetylglucosaminyltransferase
LSNSYPLDLGLTIGYSQIHVVRFTYSDLFVSTALAGWYTNVTKLLKRDPSAAKMYGNPLSDGLRLALLFKYGGAYMDLDVVSLKPIIGPDTELNKSSNFLATQVDGAHCPCDCSWEDSLNGATMIFEKGSAFLQLAMPEFVAGFDATEHAENGPRLLTRLWRRLYKPAADCVWPHKVPTDERLTVLPSKSFHVWHYGVACIHACHDPPLSDEVSRLQV